MCEQQREQFERGNRRVDTRFVLLFMRLSLGVAATATKFYTVTDICLCCAVLYDGHASWFVYALHRVSCVLVKLCADTCTNKLKLLCIPRLSRTLNIQSKYHLHTEPKRYLKQGLGSKISLISTV